MRDVSGTGKRTLDPLAGLPAGMPATRLKHAFDGKHEGTITVIFRVQPDGFRRLRVAAM